MQTKICSQCKRVLPLECFRKHSGRKDGLYSCCRECDREIRLKRYNDNKEKYRRKAREYARAHKEEVRERHRKWRERNPDYARIKSKEYHEKHKSEEKEYYQKNLGRFCLAEEQELVENCEKAKADNFVGWHRHHRLETHNSDGERRLVQLTIKELKALNMYYDRPAKELIWLTNSEHKKLHCVGVKRDTPTHTSKIIQLDKTTGEEIKVFNSITDALKELGINITTGNISSCCKGRRSSAYGYKWKYAE